MSGPLEMIEELVDRKREDMSGTPGKQTSYTVLEIAEVSQFDSNH